MDSVKAQISGEIKALLSDAWADLFYYDRKGDCEFGINYIEDAIIDGHITIEEICDNLRRQITNNVESRKLERK